MTDYIDLMEPVARRLLGVPNPRLSSRDEWRYGSRGSLSVKVGGEHRGTWSDHEAGSGGGVLDLVARVKGGDRRAANDWLKAEFDLSDDRPAPAARARIVATYPYTDEHGELLFEVVRLEPKDFRQRRPDGNGGYIWNVKGVRMVPYRLPELIEDLAQERVVFLVEGEKDVDRLRSLGIPATCNPIGANKWRDEFSPMFSGADVVILPDNDEPGREHAEKVARSLTGHADRIRIVHLVEDMPTLPVKKDISYWLDAGRTIDRLHDLVDRATTWRPRTVTRLPVIWYGDEDASPPLSWLVKGLLVDGGFSAVYGGPGASKSFLVLDLALHIAHGIDWFGRRVRQGPVLYVSGEGASGMLLRMKAWGHEKGNGSRAPFALVPSSVNLFDDDTGAEMLIDDVKAHAAALEVPLRLVVLDTLSRMIGSGDEDKARDINVVVQRAEKIQRETGAHVLIVHHSGKDRDRGMRGSNALLGAADAVIEVSRHEESGICEGKIVKVKDGSSDTPFKYTLRQSVLGKDEDGEDITSAVVEPTDASPGVARGGPKLTAPERIALDALDEVILERGVPRPIASVPAGCSAVKIDDWRLVAYRKGIADGDAEARKKAFQRCRQSLQVKRVIGIEGEWAWRG